MRYALAVLVFAAGRAIAQDGSAAPDAPPPATPATPEKADSPAPSAGRELFERAAEAIKRAQTISYRVSHYATGGLAGGKTVQADVRQSRSVGGAIPGWRVRMTGASTAADGKQQPFDIAWLINTVEAVDHDAKTVIEKTTGEMRRVRAFTLATPARVDDMTAARPFMKELAATDFELEDRQEFSGVQCDVVVVATGQGGIRTRWFLGVDDHLPRKFERIVSSGVVNGTLITELSDMRVDAAPPTQAQLESLRVTVPEGFTENRPARQSAPKPFVPTKGADSPFPPEKPDGEEAGAGAETPPPPPPPPVPAGPRMAPDFELADAAGAKHTLSAHRGSFVLLEFAGSWAVSLRDARPELTAFLDKHADRQIKAFSIAVRERSHANAVEGHKNAPTSVTLLVDGDRVAAMFQVGAIPAYALVNPRGELIVPPRHFAPEATFAAIEKALGEAASAGDAPPAATPSPETQSPPPSPGTSQPQSPEGSPPAEPGPSTPPE